MLLLVVVAVSLVLSLVSSRGWAWDEVTRGRRSSAGGVQVAGSAETWSPVRMSFTAWVPSSLMNHTNGMPRRSAYRICLPNLAALGATSQGVPLTRRASAAASLAERLSSPTTATRTALGTDREDASRPLLISGTSTRLTPKEMPTPGYVVRPSLARASYRPPEQIEPRLSLPTRRVSKTVPV